MAAFAPSTTLKRIWTPLKAGVAGIRNAPADPRLARLRLAVFSSTASKAVRLVTQTVVIGLYVRYLGVESYGLWLTAVAALGWLSWGQAGLAPGLVNAIAAAEGGGRSADQGIYFSTALAVVGVLVAAVAVVGLAVIAFGSSATARIFGAGPASGMAGTWASFLQIALFVALLRFPLALVESAYVGLQSIHVLRLWEIGGQLLSIVLVLAMSYAGVPGPLFLAAGGLAAESGVILAAVYLLVRLKPHLRPSLAKVDLRASRQMFGLSAAYFLLQIAGYLVVQVGSLMLAAYHGPAAVPLFALTMQLYQMASGVWIMFVAGLWGALAEARASGDWIWIRRVQRHLVLGSMVLATGFSVVLAVGGGWIVQVWSGGRISGDPLFFVAIAAMLLVFSWAVLHGQILSALSSVWEQVWPALANGLLVVALGLLLIPSYGATGLAVTLLGACALTTAWAYPIILKRSLRAGANVAA